MPFKALRNGEPVISLDFPEPVWRQEKARERAGAGSYACPDCGATMALATSPRGRPFFKHFPESECAGGAPKSAEHERLQVAVYQLCRALGWTTDIEARAPGGAWTADVLATDGGTTYAFEVQLASISGEDLEERSAKYRASGVVPVWLLKRLPARYPFPLPSEAFVTAWTRRADPQVPGGLDPRALTDAQVEECFLDARAEPWSVDPTIVCWRELGAVLAEFDGDDPEHERMVLGGEPATLTEVVTRALAGEVSRELSAALRARFDRYYENVEASGRARADRDRLVGEIRAELREHERERLRNAPLGDLRR